MIIIIAVVVMILGGTGCEGTDNIVNSSQTKTDSLESVISTLEIELNEKSSQLDLTISKLDNSSLVAKSCEINHKNCNSSLNDALIANITYRDTCFQSLKLDEQVRRKLEEKDNHIAGLNNKVNSIQSQLKASKYQNTLLQRDFDGFKSDFLSLSFNSPYFSEKVSSRILDDGSLDLLFQKVKPMGQEVEEIINESFNPTSNTSYYPFAFSGGWMFASDLEDFSPYQGWTFGATWRPVNRVGLSLRSSYADKRVRRYATEINRISLSVELEYNFRTKK